MHRSNTSCERTGNEHLGGTIEMPKSISFGRLDIKAVTSLEEARGEVESDKPFRIAVLGDFSGRANRGLFKPGIDLSSRRPIRIDRDNFDEVLKKIGAEIHVPVLESGNSSVVFRFNELDDFHPDRLFERSEVFQALREIRAKLDDPGTFESAAAEVRTWACAEAEEMPAEPAAEEPPPFIPENTGEEKGGLLDQMIDDAENKPIETRAPSVSSELAGFLRDIVHPHLVAGPDPKQKELVAAVDASISGLMRTILRHPDFQSLEAAWRAVHLLTSRVEADSQLKLYLIDMSKGELADDISEAEDLRSTGMYKLLAEETVETPGGVPWAVLAGNYTFYQTRQDAELLGRMSKIAGKAGAPFISAAHDNLAGCESLAETPDPEGREAWQELRKLPEASHLGLALPRFLLRLPYGKDTDPTELFDLEEMDPEPNHEHYLWGNPCFACAYLLAREFSENGWELGQREMRDIEGLPLHIFQDQEESRIKPCAEVILTERAAISVLDRGIMVLLSFRDRDMVRLPCFQSLADPASDLSGRWR